MARQNRVSVATAVAADCWWNAAGDGGEAGGRGREVKDDVDTAACACTPGKSTAHCVRRTGRYGVVEIPSFIPGQEKLGSLKIYRLSASVNH